MGSPPNDPKIIPPETSYWQVKQEARQETRSKRGTFQEIGYLILDTGGY